MTKSVREAVEFGRELLSRHRTPQSKLNAEVLLCHVLGFERIGIYLNHDRPLTSDEFSRYSALLKERSLGKPLQYITHAAHFYGHRFRVGEGVFIPRRETEVLVDQSLIRLNGRKKPLVVDVGTGCGNVAISIAIGHPAVRVVGTDISSDALAVAEENAKHLGVADRVAFTEADLFPDLSSLSSQFDLIVSNPPYIAEANLETLPTEVKAEPIGAYSGGMDGLALIKRIVDEGKEYLSPDGLIALEFGFDQGGRVESLLKESGYTDVEVTRDLSGNDRVVTGRRAAPTRADYSL
jgi:release factor glutamine methyltransferase